MLSLADCGVLACCSYACRLWVGQVAHIRNATMQRCNTQPAMHAQHTTHTHNHSLLWNYDEVLALLEGSGIVVATLAGHAHM